jgi:hypothetical protein
MSSLQVAVGIGGPASGADIQEALAVQDLWLDGRRGEAAGVTTDEKLATLRRFLDLVREPGSGEDGAKSEGGSDA